MRQLYPPLRTTIKSFTGVALSALLLCGTACEQNVIDRVPDVGNAGMFVTLEQAAQAAHHVHEGPLFHTGTQASQRNKIAQAAKATGGASDIASSLVLGDAHRPDVYVFNFTDGGFCAISGDRRLMPIMAYSETGLYGSTNKPGGLQFWERRSHDVVADVRETNPAQKPEIAKQWKSVESLPLPPEPEPTTDPSGEPVYQYSTIVGPLLQTTWGQGCTYNDECPLGTSACSHKWTGCVATSMAQIIRYWQPATTPVRTYNWSAMPNNQGSPEVARLMRDVGNAVGMNYSSDGGSEASTKDEAAGAFKGAFGFRSATYIDYGPGATKFQRIKDNLASQQPVIFRGCDSQGPGCHAWVCDGFQEDVYSNASYMRFHMNWGWHEVFSSSSDYNGWFSYNNWYIPGANYNFQNDNGAVVDIRP